MFGGRSKSYNCAKHMIPYSTGGCPECANEAALAARQQNSFIGVHEQLRQITSVDYEKQIKELERKFIEVQKLMVEEIEKLNERILELESKDPTT